MDGPKLPDMNHHSGNSARATWVRILGVDPAAAGPTGYGIIETDWHDCAVLHYGAVQVPAKRQKYSPGAVLQEVHELLCSLIREFKPTAMAVESVFTALNMRTALRLAEVRGVVLLAAEQNGMEVRSYSPREVKACVSGYGHADKKQMQVMVRALLNMREIPEPSDAADALAVALCHIQAARFERRFGVSSPTDKVLHGKRVSFTADATRTRSSGIQSNQ
jgi:crossover junction endodeoxyribonuclease RuvC